MQDDQISRLETYKQHDQTWIDQAVLLINQGGNVHTPIHGRLAAAMEQMYALGQSGKPAPAPVDWKAYYHEMYVKPCYPIMRAAGQKVPESASTPRRILRRTTV
jgi:hypothetical protein